MSNIIQSYDFEQAKVEYRAFCEAGNHDIQIFALPWYLDAVCDSPDDWRVILYKENDVIRAAFPFAYTKGKYGLWHIHNPWMAPRLGIWIDYYQDNLRESRKEAYENKITAYMIQQLPYYDRFEIAFDARYQNWQQFYREGFCQTSHYSYIMPVDTDLQEYLPKRIQKKVFTVQKEYKITADISPQEYWAFFNYSYRQRGRVPSYSEKQFLKICNAVIEHHCGKLFQCRNLAGNIAGVAGVFFDSNRVYKMFNTFDTGIGTDIQPLMTYYSLAYANSNQSLFDFEGSMIPGVANYNMNFNAIKEPYFVISKSSERYLLLSGVRQTAKALKHIIFNCGIHQIQTQ